MFIVDEMDGENREMLKIGIVYILNRSYFVVLNIEGWVKKWKLEYRNFRKICFFKIKVVVLEDSKFLIFSFFR